MRRAHGGYENHVLAPGARITTLGRGHCKETPIQESEAQGLVKAGFLPSDFRGT
jgi:hypothetical protein